MTDAEFCLQPRQSYLTDYTKMKYLTENVFKYTLVALKSDFEVI